MTLEGEPTRGSHNDGSRSDVICALREPNRR